MRPHLYILDENGEPLALPTSDWLTVREDSLTQWGQFMEKSECHVADEMVNGIRVSTVFLGLDYSFSEEGPAILWETMCFADKANDGHPLDQEQDRCSGSREQALAMHQRMVEKVRSYEHSRTTTEPTNPVSHRKSRRKRT